MTDEKKPKVLILGGGFGGVYAGKRLEKLRAKNPSFDIALVARDNYFTFQPMLAEVVGGSLGIADSITSLRHLLPSSEIYVREIREINLEKKEVFLSPTFSHSDIVVSYDHLILALGNVCDFRNSSGGLREHALPFKDLRDAVRLRNHLIEVLETAAFEKNTEELKQLLTFVVGGGGFSGVEVVAELNDFVREFAKKYKNIDPNLIRVVLVHSKESLVEKELPPSLSEYTRKILEKKGVEIIFNTHLVSATPYEAVLDEEVRIASRTIVASVPSDPNPLIEGLDLEKDHGRVKTNEFLQTLSREDVWALGDCAYVPQYKSEDPSPPTAQFATRQGATLANNLVAHLQNKQKKPFKFESLGVMAALGHHSAVAELFGRFKFSGFLAWMMWRFVYAMKLPTLSRKVKVCFTWFLDLFLPQEVVQLKTVTTEGLSHLHFIKGDIIFHKGDLADFLYVIVEGKVEIIEEKEGACRQIAVLEKGQYFGEMGILGKKRRVATVRCLEDCRILAIRERDFELLITHFGNMREEFIKTNEARLAELNKRLAQ